MEADDSSYPVVDGKGVVYYSKEDASYIRGDRKDGERLATPTEIKQLADQLK
ncbi:hypothetical protein [Paenibacillus sp. RC21]|uniref:hypothetical protein n=1 Tax=Paenibacillus sp. RC21 TaxID=3156312 RepID=UPI00383404E5